MSGIYIIQTTVLISSVQTCIVSIMSCLLRSLLILSRAESSHLCPHQLASLDATECESSFTRNIEFLLRNRARILSYRKKIGVLSVATLSVMEYIIKKLSCIIESCTFVHVQCIYLCRDACGSATVERCLHVHLEATSSIFCMTSYHTEPTSPSVDCFSVHIQNS